MLDVFVYLAVVMALAVFVIVGAFLLRTFLAGGNPKEVVGRLFAPKPTPRVHVVEQYNVDNRRRLVLIRRDDVEHLIMTGGPVDVVIETGIEAPVSLSQASLSGEEPPSTFPSRVPVGP